MPLSKTQSLTYSALFLSLALVFPSITAFIPELGQTLLPMHLPILLCGFICGWKQGGIIGLIAPVLRSLIFGMPPLFPTAIAMAFELAAYGIMAGLMAAWMPKKWPFLYVSLLVSMIVGRIVWGGVMFLLLAVNETIFTFEMFIAGTLINALPGILLQFVLIPPILQTYRNHREKGDTNG